MPNLSSIPLKTKESLMYHCSCHGNLVTTTKQKCFLANMNSVQVNTRQLLRPYSDCHGNLVAVAMKKVSGAYSPKEASWQI